jgi:hypothetical protein
MNPSMILIARADAWKDWGNPNAMNVVGWIQNEFGLRLKEPEDWLPSLLSMVRKSDAVSQVRNSSRVGIVDLACPLLFLGISEGLWRTLEFL